MPIYNYYCIDCNCGAKKQSEKEFQITKAEENKKEPEYCVSGVEKYALENNIDIVTETEKIPSDVFNAMPVLKLMGEVMHGGYAKFSSLNPEQKRELLKKRSKQDFIKNIKERKIAAHRELGLNDDGKYHRKK